MWMRAARAILKPHRRPPPGSRGLSLGVPPFPGNPHTGTGCRFYSVGRGFIPAGSCNRYFGLVLRLQGRPTGRPGNPNVTATPPGGVYAAPTSHDTAGHARPHTGHPYDPTAGLKPRPTECGKFAGAPSGGKIALPCRAGIHPRRANAPPRPFPGPGHPAPQPIHPALHDKQKRHGPLTMPF